MATMTIGAAIGWWAERDPAAVAVRCLGEEITRLDLDLATNRIARSWREAGVRQDDYVVVSLPNSVDFVLATVAAWKAGATPVPLSPVLDEPDRAAVLDLVSPALVIDSALDRCVGFSTEPGPDLAASSWKAPTSSGSTGRPKIVRAAAAAYVDPETPTADFIPRRAVQLVAGPLFHAAPFVYAMRGLMTGHTLVLMETFEAGEWLRIASSATWGMVVPTMMQQIARHPAWDTASLELSVLHLGARCSQPVKRAWLERLGADRVYELYAGTESAGLAVIDGQEWLIRPGSVGRGVGGTRFRIQRPDGSECAPGEVGEIRMRRPMATYSYLGADPDVVDGWHTLGDRGWLDPEGYLYVGDRGADIIATERGEVWPADVEAVIDEHPAVRSSVVVERGQDVHAVVHTEASVDELIAWTQDRLEAHQRPLTWRLVDEPLRDDTGKVSRYRWR